MSDDRRAQLKSLLDSGAVTLQPLSFPQRELWEASHVPAQDAANHICAVVHVKGTIPPQACSDCVRDVMQRQEAMRTSFLPGKGAPMQMIRREGILAVACRDLPADQQSGEAVEKALREVFLEPFDLLRGPLYRVVMVRKSPDDVVLAFAIHHAIADGWSLGVFVQDLCVSYLQYLLKGFQPLPEPALTYSAWAAAERQAWTEERLQRSADYWLPRLQNIQPIWPDLETKKPESHLLERRVTSVPSELAAPVRELARRSGATLFSTLLSCFHIALAKWTGVLDSVVGTPVANRGNAGVNETMGYCAGNLPLRHQLQPEQRFSEFLREVQSETLDAFAHAMPYVELIRRLGLQPSVGASPLYQVRFALQNHPVPDIAVPGLSLKLRMRSTGTTRFALGCEITEEGDALEVVWLHRKDKFSAAELENLHESYLQVLKSVCEDANGRLAALLQ